MTQVTWPPSGRDGTVLFRRLRHRRLTNRSGTAGLLRLRRRLHGRCLNPPVVADSADSISFRARRQVIDRGRSSRKPCQRQVIEPLRVGQEELKQALKQKQQTLLTQNAEHPSLQHFHYHEKLSLVHATI
jgi:hypothetical protein